MMQIRLTAPFPEQLLVGVSGGADSVALLRLLMEAGVRVTAVHVNHGLRGDASDEDEAFVRKLCGRLAVPLMCFRADPPADPGEDWARRARYGFFREAAERSGIKVIALAHHRDDQAETLLMHLLRGSGLTGLTGIAADRETEGLRILRPLLGYSRQELRNWLRFIGQDWREDATNADPRYLRNALRRDVLPQLEQLVPGAAARLARTAELLRDEELLMQAQAETFLSRCNGGKELPLSALRAEPLALRRRIVRLWWSRATDGQMAERSLSAEQTEALVSLIEAPAASRCNLPAGWIGQTGWTHLHLLELPKSTPSVGGKPLLKPTPIECSDVIRLAPYAGDKGDGRRCQAIPAAMLPGLTVRSRQPGDWIRPFGSSGRQSLQDYLVNRRVDAPFRDRVPLLCRGSEVLLAGGVGAGDVPRVTDTENCVLVCWIPAFPWHDA